MIRDILLGGSHRRLQTIHLAHGHVLLSVSKISHTQGRKPQIKQLIFFDTLSFSSGTGSKVLIVSDTKRLTLSSYVNDNDGKREKYATFVVRYNSSSFKLHLEIIL